MKLNVMSSIDVVVLLFDGKRLIDLATGKSWPAVSGPYGKGKAPVGEYVVSKPENLEDNRGNAPYRDKKGNVWFAKLDPNFKTERTGFGIHPDGNVPGTLGCVGLKQADTSEVRDYLASMPNVILYVV